MNAIENLLQSIENRKGGMYKSYYLLKSNSVSSDMNEIVFAYKNGRGSGYISQDGVNHSMYIDDHFFNGKEADLSIYIGATEKYTCEESGLLYNLYQTTIAEIMKSIEDENIEIEKEYNAIYAQIEKSEKKQTEFKSAFEAARSDDMIDSGYGYMVRKRDFHLAQKYGYDGIENKVNA